MGLSAVSPVSPVSPVSHYQCLQSHHQPILPLQVPSQYGPGLTTEQLGQLAIASLAAGGGKKRPRESGDELLLVSITSFSSVVFPPNSPGCWDHYPSLSVNFSVFALTTHPTCCTARDQFWYFCCRRSSVLGLVRLVGLISLTYCFHLPHSQQI